LIWNIGIVDGIYAIIRAYDGGTGHDDSVKSIKAFFNENEKIAESFLNYFESITY